MCAICRSKLNLSANLGNPFRSSNSSRGSGGGVFSTNTVGAGTAGQGNNGAFGSLGPYSTENTYAGGGGGGAGAVGTAATSVAPVQGGAGGIGRQISISGTPTYYAGGGGGGTTTAVGGGAGGAGGLGGGGAGGGSNSIVGIAGINGTGGGGGCGGFSNAGGNFASGKGGSGIVIVRYPLPVRLTGTPLFNQLSPSAVASSVGAFSLRAVNGTSARAVQVRPVAEFPPGVFTETSTVISALSYSQYLTGYPFGGTGVYTSNSSSGTGASTRSWRAFDGVIGGSGSRWVSDNTYVANTPYSGAASTIAVGVTYPGEWLQIQLPQAIVLSSYSIYPQSTNIPATWNVFASNDGTTWTVIDQRGTAPTTGQYNNYTISGSPAAYSYYRIGCYIISLNVSFAIVEMKLYGAPPNTATDFYADRLGNLLTAPVTGQSLANWLGGATGYVTTWYNQIQPGQDVSATVAANQPTIDPVNKTIVFNGSTHSFSNTATTGGLLAACVGPGTKYTYTATWNKTGSSVARICEHEPLNTTTNQASGLSSLATTYGFSGQNNDNTLIASFTAGTQVSTVMRLNNTAAPNLRVRSNGTDYSGSTGDYTTLSLNNYWFAIGRKASSNSEFFNGTMKNVMVFKDAISDADTAVLDAWQQSL